MSSGGGVLTKADVECMIADCGVCASHVSGTCWTHKMQYMRASSVAVTVPEAFKSEFTNRERVAEAHSDAAAKGRSIRPYSG